MAVVYQHRRLDTNEIFYVGIGKSIRRAYIGSTVRKLMRKTRWRNNHWNHIVLNTEYEIEILHNGIDYEEAKRIEVDLIKQYGRRDLGLGSLVNMTDGGDGTPNVSEEVKKKITRLGMKHTEESKRKIGIASSILNKGRKHTEETKNKLSKSMMGKQLRLGAVLSQETKDKISESHMGKPGTRLGFINSEEMNRKISETRIKKGLSKGENNGRAKLNKKSVEEIRNKYKTTNITQQKLAEEYNISKSSVSAIITKRVWNF